MLSNGTWVAWAAHLVLCGAAVAAADADFFIEGVADPAYERTRPGVATSDAFERRVCQQAYTDAVYHVAAYARGIPFRFDFSDPAQPKREFGKMEYQSVARLLPKAKAFRMLDSGLAVARITYAAKDVPRLKLSEELRELPVYPVLGEFHDPRAQVRRTVMHWLAVKDCYRTAVMVHLARKYGNQPVLKVSGRVYPIEITQAQLVPVAEPETPADESGTGEGPPASAPAEPAPGDSATPGDAPGGDAATPADATGTDAATPADATGPDAATPADATGGDADQGGPDAEAAPDTPRVWDSRKLVYRLEMGVRVQIDVDGIQFAEAPVPQPVPETTPPEPGTDPQDTRAPDGS